MRGLYAVWAVILVSAFCARAHAQSAWAASMCPGEAVPASLPQLSYDVASIRPAADDWRMSFRGSPHEADVTITGLTGRDLVADAFNIRQFQLLGGADWLSTRRFDLQAKGDNSANVALAKLSNCYAGLVKSHMLEAVLAERMKLAEGRPLQVSIRATNIFRKEKGEWKMIGHHTDLLPFLDKQPLTTPTK